MNLTTITPHWGRPAVLLTWVRALKGASFTGLTHLVYFVGEDPPDWWERETEGTSIIAIVRPEKPGLSIGHYHNLGANLASTRWIMKLDVDAVVHQEYFRALLMVLFMAKEKEWFNGGMVSVPRDLSTQMLTSGKMPLKADVFYSIHGLAVAVSGYKGPKASNFICNREDYLKLGGCDERFRNYGWEDYQQIYMLERHQQGKDPLPGSVEFSNVTERCRDEIGRPKAMELFKRDSRLCLLHCWHPSSSDPSYKTRLGSDNNKRLVLDHILNTRFG